MKFRVFCSLCVIVGSFSGCGEDTPVTTGIVVGDTSGGTGDGYTLADGWQSDKDASAPDGWIWSEDAGSWIGPDSGDSTYGIDDPNMDVGPLNDGKTGSDGQNTSDGQVSSDSTNAKPGELGGDCKTNGDCKQGFCVGAGYPGAYCTTFGCKGNGDCAQIPSSDPVCCMTYGDASGTQSYCLKQTGAQQCGNADVPVGQSCEKGGNSDCAGQGNWCLQTAGAAECVQGCSTIDDPVCGKGTTCNVFPGGGGCIPFTPGVPDGSSCVKDPIGGCGKYAFCIESYTGDPFAYCATQCTSDKECPGGEGCFLYAANQGICQNFGNKAVGDNCSGDRFSCGKGMYCVGFGGGSAVCAPQCASDANCSDLAKAIGGSAYCAKNSGSPVGVCYPKGDGKNGSNCSKDPYTCGEGMYCIGGYDVYDPGAFCQKSCQDDGICPSGSQCVKYNKDYSGCQVSGTLPQGGDCKGDPTLCKAGEFCLGAGKNWQCMTQCEVAKPSCGSGTACIPYGQDGLGVCWPGGKLTVGSLCADDPWSCTLGSLCSGYGNQKNSTCLQNCDNSSCPGKFACTDFGLSGHWCQPVGNGTQGSACGPTAPCAEGSVCIGQEGPAPFCSKQCKVDGDCPSDASGKKAWCAVGKWGGYCLPDGGLGKNELCYQKPWACAKGLLCLGDSTNNPGAFCAEGCSGFASACAKGEKCEYLGGGDAFCFKTGNLPAGSACLQDPLGCAPDTLCIKGSPLPECLTQCGPGFPACPKDAPCTGLPGSAVKLCVPKDFVPYGAINVPF